MTTVAQKNALNFVHLMTQFLNAMSDVFPECSHVSLYKTGWEFELLKHTSNDKKVSLGKKAAESYDESMHPYVDMCKEKDVTILQYNIDIMKNGTILLMKIQKMHFGNMLTV